jgi:hypothetical protein
VAVIGVCAVVVLAGLVAVARWGGLTVEPPPAPAPGDPPAVGLVVRRYLWAVNLAVVAGIGAGIMAAGAGGRLVMRLLAVTAGDEAQGRITEANEVVGRISAGGTVELVVFTALFFGTASGGAYLLVRRWLPGGRAGGLVYGVLLLLVAGTRLARPPARPGRAAGPGPGRPGLAPRLRLSRGRHHRPHIGGGQGRDRAALARRPRSAGEPCAEVVEDLDRRPLECGCDAVRDLPKQHDARHGHVVGRDAAEPGQQLIGADELSAVQPPGKGDEKLGCLVLGWGEEVAMRRGHALPS